MSIKATYKRMTPQEFFEIQNNPEFTKSVFEFDLLKDAYLTDINSVRTAPYN